MTDERHQRGRTAPTKDMACKNCVNYIPVDYDEDNFYFKCKVDKEEHSPFDSCKEI